MHLDLDDAVAGAGLAAAALHVEAEAALSVALGLGVRRSREEVADHVEHAGVGRRVAPGSAADGALVDGNDLVQLLQSFDAPEFSGDLVGPVQPLCQIFVQNLIHQGGLAGAGHAGDAGHDAQRELHVDVLQVVLFCAPDRKPAGGLPALLRHRDLQLPGQILPRDAAFALFKILRRALGDDLPAVFPGPRADIHDPVGGPHGVLVVLHHDHGIPQVPQVLQGSQQLVVVPLVEADAGLVQDIGDAHQARPDLGRQPDALGFTAGQGFGGTGQGQVIQAHIDQEGHPVPDLLQDLGADHLLHLRKLQAVQEHPEFRDGHIRGIVNVDAAHSHRKTRFLQALSAAFGAGGDPHEGFIFRLGAVGEGLPVPAVLVLDQALEGDVVNSLASLAFVVDLDLLAAGAVDQDVPDPFRIIAEGRVKAEAVMLCQSHKDGVRKAPLLCGGGPAGGDDGALADGQTFVRDHQFRGKLHFVAQSCADRTGAERIVEGKAPGLHLLDGDPAVRTGKALGEVQHLSADHLHHGGAAGQGQSSLQRVRETLLYSFPDHKTVHHYLDGVLDVLVEDDVLGKLVQVSVDPDADVAALLCLGKDLLVPALFPPDHRCQKLDPCLFREFQHLVHHLVDGLLHDRLSAVRTVRNADPGVKKTHVVVDLRHRAHGGTRIPVRALLVDGDRGGKPLDALHVRLLHPAQEHPGIGRKRLHIAPLPFRVDRVKRETRFSGTGEACQDHQFLPRNVQRHVLQIVLRRPADLNILFPHIVSLSVICIIQHPHHRAAE